MLGAGLDAAGEFERILDQRGSDPLSAFDAVALVGLARAFAVLVEARAECRELTGGAASVAETCG